MAVSDGVLDDNYRDYWMSHKGEMSARYSTNKSKLPVDLIEGMRAHRSLPVRKLETKSGSPKMVKFTQEIRKLHS